jgi:hypothetical protein
MKRLSQDSLSMGQDLRQRPPEYEAGVLTVRLRLFTYNVLNVRKS